MGRRVVYLALCGIAGRVPFARHKRGSTIGRQSLSVTPEEYTVEEITTMLDTADDEERFIPSSFLCSGFRSRELAYLTYRDINFATNIWRVEMKEGESAEWDRQNPRLLLLHDRVSMAQ